MKENSDMFPDFNYPLINPAVNNGDFPLILNLANVIPVFKKGSKSSKYNYRPISTLKDVSKIFGSIMFKQIGAFMDSFFSKFQCGFRKGYGK